MIWNLEKEIISHLNRRSFLGLAADLITIGAVGNLGGSADNRKKRVPVHGAYCPVNGSYYIPGDRRSRAKDKEEFLAYNLRIHGTYGVVIKYSNPNPVRSHQVSVSFDNKRIGMFYTQNTKDSNPFTECNAMRLEAISSGIAEPYTKPFVVKVTPLQESERKGIKIDSIELRKPKG